MALLLQYTLGKRAKYYKLGLYKRQNMIYNLLMENPIAIRSDYMNNDAISKEEIEKSSTIINSIFDYYSKRII